MPLPPDYLFHLLDELRKRFRPSDQPASGTNPAEPFCGIMCFSTSRFDEMKRFLTAMGFVVTEGRNQLLPLFSKERGARVSRGDFDFNLEEDTSKQHVANFNMHLVDLSEDEINRAKSSGFEFTYEQSPYGEFYTFKSPDGGTFVIN